MQERWFVCNCLLQADQTRLRSRGPNSRTCVLVKLQYLKAHERFVLDIGCLILTSPEMNWLDTFGAHRLKSKETAGASSEVQLIFSLLSQKIPLPCFIIFILIYYCFFVVVEKMYFKHLIWAFNDSLNGS